jgi:hypothetical protein
VRPTGWWAARIQVKSELDYATRTKTPFTEW